MKRVQTQIISFVFFTLSLVSWAQGNDAFVKVNIDPLFRDILTSATEFMNEGGAQLIVSEDGRIALIGIGKVFPEKKQPELMPEIRRKGEIRARAAVLDLGEDVEIATSRGITEGAISGRRVENRMSLSSFFQTTETHVKGMIQQIPIIGTWWSIDHGTFYVAVGKMVDVASQPAILTGISPSPLSRNTDSYKDMEGKEPFLSLLQGSPVLCRNGGVRGFFFENNRKALIAVGSAKIKGVGPKALNQASKVARLKAMRSLLENREGIQLSSVEYLKEQEQLWLYTNSEQCVFLSQFLSIQEERVSGLVKALPKVATWEDPTGRILYFAIGKFFVGVED
jgi:hypothetical protein